MRILQPALNRKGQPTQSRDDKGESAKSLPSNSHSGAIREKGVRKKSSKAKHHKAGHNKAKYNKAQPTPAQPIDQTFKSNAEPGPELEALPPGKKRRRSELMQAAASAKTDQGGLAEDLFIDPAKKAFNELLARGIRLLAMREHSVSEITNKLLDKSDNSSLVPAVVDELLQSKYLSDERFTESYIRARGNRGFGPVKIRAELKSKGVSSVLIQEHLNESSALWFDRATEQYSKKYGRSVINDYAAWTKRARFMQSRGFSMEHIHSVIPRPEYD